MALILQSTRKQHGTLQLANGEALAINPNDSYALQDTASLSAFIPHERDLIVLGASGDSYLLKDFFTFDLIERPELILSSDLSLTWQNFQLSDDDAAPFASEDTTIPLFITSDASGNIELQAPPAGAVAEKLNASHIPSTAAEGSPTVDIQANLDERFETIAYRDAVQPDPTSDVNIDATQIEAIEAMETVDATPRKVEVDISDFIEQDGEKAKEVTAKLFGQESNEFVSIDQLKGTLTLETSSHSEKKQWDIELESADMDGKTRKSLLSLIPDKVSSDLGASLLISQDKLYENVSGALIGKLDTDIHSRGNLFEYEIIHDKAGIFEIDGNILKLRDGIAIDYEAHPQSYDIKIRSTREDGTSLEQDLRIWPQDQPEAYGVKSIEEEFLAGSRSTTLDPEAFVESFDNLELGNLESIQIVTEPDDASLTLGGNNLSAGDVVTVGQIGQVNFVPKENWDGSSTFDWIGNNGSASSDKTLTTTIDTETINNAPVTTISIGELASKQDADFSYDIPRASFEENDLGEGVRFTGNLPHWLNLDETTGQLTGAPTYDSIGQHSITITATDAEGDTVNFDLAIRVDNINDSPTVTPIEDLNIDEDGRIDFDPSENFTDKDIEYGDSLTYDVTLSDGSPLPDWIEFDSATGRITGQPAGEVEPTYTIRISATDTEGETAETLFKLNIDEDNQPELNQSPELVSAIEDHTVAEDANLTVEIADHFSDADLADTLTYTATLKDGSPLPNWISLNNTTGTLTGVPNNSEVGELAITITASDGETNVEDTFALTVENTNDGPVAIVSFETQTTQEDDAFTFDVSANFKDQDLGDTLTFTAALENGDPLPQWLELNPQTGQLSGTPENDDVGNLNLVVIASDGSKSANETLRINIENTNDKPTVSAQFENQSIQEDSSFSLDPSQNFSDQDLGDTLTFTATLENGDPLPDWLELNAQTGQLSGTPDNGDVGTLSIKVTATDSSSATANDTFTITVENTNDGPTATAQTDDQTTAEDSAFTLDTSSAFTDIDVGDTLTYSASLENGDNLPDWLTINSETGKLSGTPENEDVGDIAVKVTASDGQESASDTFTITVENTNDGPTVTAATANQSTDEDAVFSLDASSAFTDIDVGDTLTYSASLENGDNLPDWLTINSETGQLSGTPGNGDVGNISVKVTASDNAGSQATDTFAITVENTNDGPTVTAQTANQTTAEDSAFSLDTSSAFTDIDVGDTLTYSASLENGDNLPDWLTINSETGKLSGTPENGDVGDIAVKVTASDGQESASDTFTITVENTNDGPTVTAQIANQSTDEDSAFTLDASSAFTDVDAGDTLTYSASLENGDNLPDWLTINSETGQLSGTPGNGDVGNISVKVTASDNAGSQATDTFAITVENTNDGPTATAQIDNQSTAEDAAFSLNVSSAFTDEDLGDTLTYSASLENGDTLPDWLTINSETGKLSGTPENEDVGDIAVKVTASDGQESASDTFSISVENTNDGPTVTAQVADQSTAEDSAFTLDASSAFTDVDVGDTLTYSASLENGDNLPDWLTINSETGQLSGTPENQDVGNLAIKVTASDGEESASDTFAITVENTNDGPTVTAQIANQSTDEDAVFSLDASSAFTDIDTGDTLTYSASLENGDNLPDWLTINSETGQLSGTPENGDVGNISVKVTASDGQESASDTFTITVENTNDGPTATAQIADQTTAEDNAFTLDASSAFTDVDVGDTLTYTATLQNGDPIPDWLTINSETGQLSGTPENEDVGDIAVKVTASDNAGSQATDTFNITVENTNDGPTVTAQTANQTTAEDSAFTLDASSAFTDIDTGDTLTYSASLENGDNLPDWLTINSETGQLSGTPENGDVGGIAVKVTASDNAGSQATDTFAITVENTNDGPTVTAQTANQTTAEDSAFSLDTSAAFTDVDTDDTLSYTATLQNGDPIPDWLTINSETGQLSGTPENEDVGDIAVKVTASDNAGSQATDTFGITVENTNDGPTAIQASTQSLYQQDFSDLANGEKSETGESAWSTDDSLATRDATHGVSDEAYNFSQNATKNTDGRVTLQTEAIDISEHSNLTLSFDLKSSGTMDTSGSYHDQFQVVAIVDGERHEIYQEDGHLNQGSNQMHTIDLKSIPKGDELVIAFEAKVTGMDEIYQLDNVQLNGETVGFADQSASEDSVFSFEASNAFSDSDVGDTLTYSASLENGDNLPDWLTINSETGQLSGTPENGDVGNLSVKITATDNAGSQASDTIAITVENTNDGPTAIAQIADQVISEDNAFTLDASANFIDIDAGDSLTYTASLENGDNLPEWLSINSETGQLSGTPENGHVGSLSIKVTATDSEGSQASDAFAITVENTNDGPTVIRPSLYNEDFSGLTDGDQSDSGDSTWSTDESLATRDATHGVSDEAYNFSQNATKNTDGRVTLQTEAIDISEHSNLTLSFDLKSSGTMDTSGSNHDQFQVVAIVDGERHEIYQEDGHLNLGSNQMHTIDLTSIPKGGELIISFEAQVTGMDEVYQLDNIQLNGETIGMDDQTTDEDAVFSLDASSAFTDIDVGDTLTYSASLENGDNLPDWLTINSETGELSGTPENEDVGNLAIKVTATDNDGAAATDTFTITVENTNDGPTVTAQTADQTTDEDAVFSLDASSAFTDIDLGDTLTYSASLENGDPIPDWLAINSETGQLSGTPENQDVGNLSLTVTATDTSGAVASDTFSIQVENTNDGPTVTAATEDQTTAEDAVFSLDASSAFTDVDVGDTLSYTATLQNGDPIPDWLTIDSETGQLSGTPENADVGNLNLTITATDTSGAAASDTFSIQVENTNDGPTVTESRQTLFSENFDAAVDGEKSGDDWSTQDSTVDTRITHGADSGEYRFSLSTNVSGDNDSVNRLTTEPIDISDKSDLNLTFDIRTEDSLEDSGDWHDFFTVIAEVDGQRHEIHQSDGNIGDTIAIDLSNIPQGDSLVLSFEAKTTSETENFYLDNVQLDGDVIGLTSIAATEDAAFTLDASTAFTDVDAGDTLTYSATLQNGDPLPDWITIDSESGLLSGTPENEDVGSLSLTVTATDTSGASASDTLSIQVENTNDGPVAITQEPADPDVYEIVGANLVQNGSFEDSNGANSSGWTLDSGPGFQLKSTGNWYNIDSSEGNYYLDTDHSPGNISFSQEVANITDGAPYELSLDVAQFSSYDAALEIYFGGELVGTVTADGSNMVSHTFVVEGGSGDGSDKLQFVEVGDVDYGGTALDNVQLREIEYDNTLQTDEDAAFSLDASAHFSDEDAGDTLTYSATLENGDPLPDWLSIDSETGLLSGTPENQDVGSLSLAVTATDASGSAASSSISIQVENTNDGPTVLEGRQTLFSEDFDNSTEGDKSGDNWTAQGEEVDPVIAHGVESGEYRFSRSAVDAEESQSVNSLTTDPIDISGKTDLKLSFDIRSEGEMNDSTQWHDFFTVVATVDGQRHEVHQIDGSVGSSTSIDLSNIPDGDTLVLSFEARTTSLQESFFFDNVQLDGEAIDLSSNDATEDSAFSIDLSHAFADEDVGDTLSYSATLENGDPLPDWLSIDSETGQLSGTPENEDVGSLSLSITATDTSGAFASKAISIQVENTNDGPVATADTAAVVERETVEIDVLANDSDIDVGDSLTITQASVPPGKGSVSIVDNKIIYDPEDDFPDLAENDTTTVEISYTITDESGATSTSQATVTVTGDDSLIYLDDKNNYKTGSNENNEIHGEGGKDKIDGSGGDDTLIGGGGNDTLVGSNGNDTAVFSGNHADYSIHQNPDGGYTVVDQIEGRDGTDIVSSVETFRFNDGDLQAADSINTFTVVLDGDGAVDYTFDADTNTLTISEVDGTNNNSTLTITDLSGNDISVDTINLDSDLGTLNSNANLGTITIADNVNIQTLTVDNGNGSVDAINFEGSTDSALTISANAGSITAASNLNGDLTLNGDLGTITANAITGKISVSGNATTIQTIGANVGGDMKEDITIGGNVETIHSNDDIEGTISIGGNLGSLSAVDDIKNANITVQGNTGSITAGDDVSGNIILKGNLNTLDIGSDLNGNITIDRDLAYQTINGDTNGSLTADSYGYHANTTVNGDSSAETITTGDGDDTIDGNGGDDHISSGAGDDTIDARDGADTVSAGAGDDTITINSGSGTPSDFGTYDGGEGEDALVFDGASLEIDFTELNANAVTNIESLDINGSGANSLKLSADDVLDMTDGDNKLFIEGGSDDEVEFSDTFVSQGSETVDGVDYTHYYDASSDAHLYINNDITNLDTF